jgi:hypothetical protein
VALTLEQLPAVLVGGVFLYAASFKVLDAQPLVATLRSLGVPKRLAAPLGWLAPFLEVTVGLALIGFGNSAGRLGASLLLLAGLAIGAAGTVAIHKGEPIPCSCFSTYVERSLGTRQIATGLGFLVSAAILFVINPRFQLTEALAWLSIAALTASSIHSISSARLVKDLAGYRRAASINFAA